MPYSSYTGFSTPGSFATTAQTQPFMPAGWSSAGGGVSQTRTPTVPNLPVAAVPTPASVGELANLTQQINAMLRTGTKAAQEARIPGGPALEAQSSKVIGQELAGSVPDDVIRLLQQQGAEGAPGTGVNAQAAYLRALGLTSIGQEQAGETNLSAALARNPAAPIFDPATQLLTPGQAGQLALGQQQQNLAAQAEADRVALEQQRLALESARRGGGGGGYGGEAGGAPIIPGSNLPSYATGATAYGTPEFTTQDWLASIGWTPGQQFDQSYYDAVLGPAESVLRPEDTGVAAVSGSPEEGV